MDAKEWQRLADEVAAEVTAELDRIDADFWPEPSDPSFRAFWPRVKALSERIQTAPAIDIEVKLTLQSRLRRITRRARQDQEVFFEEHRRLKQELLDRIRQTLDRAAETSDPVELREVRAEIGSVREDIERVTLPTRGDRQEVWQAWQSASQQIWAKLNEIWSRNESELQSLLDQARTRLNSGNVKETRELIRRFNDRSREIETSHKSLRTLRANANSMWRQADEVAKAKHEAFMATADERVGRWKEVQGKNARAIARLRAEIDDLERSAGQTDVAAAFARAMIEDKARELERLQSSNESLEDRIEHTETALTTAG